MKHVTTTTATSGLGGVCFEVGEYDYKALVIVNGIG